MRTLPVVTDRPPAARADERRALIAITTMCNARCAFCCVLDTLDKPELNPSDDEIRARIDAAVADGCTGLAFTGGEPTVHPRFAELVRYGREKGLAWVSINTNGIQFKSRAWTERALEAGLTHIDFSLHGHTPALHDALVERPGALDACIRGLGHLRELRARYPITLGATVVVTATNGPHLAEIVQFLIDQGIEGLRLKHCFEGAPGADVALVEEYGTLLPAVRDAAERAVRAGVSLQLTHFPLCLLAEAGAVSFASDLVEENVLSIDKDGSVLLDGRAAMFRRSDAGPCGACLLGEVCTKLEPGLAAHATAGSLHPVHDAASLHAFFTDADRARALNPMAREKVDALLRFHGAPALERRAPDPRTRGPSARGNSPGQGRSQQVLLAGSDCGRSCGVCDCAGSVTQADREGVPLLLGGGGERLVVRAEGRRAASLLATVRRARAEAWRHVWVCTTRAAGEGLVALEDVREAGATGIVVPWFSTDASVFARVSGDPEARAQATEALLRAHAMGLSTAVEIPLLEVNAPGLELTVLEALGAGVSWVRLFVPVRAQQHRVARFDLLTDSLAAAAARAAHAGARIRFEAGDGVPRCALPPGVADAYFPDRRPAPPAPPGWSHGLQCSTCALQPTCRGVSRAYVEAHGHAGLQPWT